MTNYRIRLTLEPNPNGVFTVTSPDVPGLVTEGQDAAEIQANVQEALSALMEAWAEVELIQRAKIYLAMVDEPDGHAGTPERDAERTAAHERLMDEMERCGIPFSSRYEARWIARWLISQHQPHFDSTRTLMWAKPNGDNEWFKEIRHAPPQDNKEGWIPVVVKFESLASLGKVYARNTD
ncbi:MAG: hypothetical protein HY741_26045 [Chloroflexi bacterium]|nr:hypothetical protein [Chloroflexota bacterium]